MRRGASSLNPACQLLQAGVDPLDGVFGQVLDPLGEYALRFARKPVDRQVELAAEPFGGLLSRCADRHLHLLRGGLGVPRRLARDNPAQLLELAVLDIAELGADPLRCFGDLALDLLL